MHRMEARRKRLIGTGEIHGSTRLNRQIIATDNLFRFPPKADVERFFRQAMKVMPHIDGRYTDCTDRAMMLCGLYQQEGWTDCPIAFCSGDAKLIGGEWGGHAWCVAGHQGGFLWLDPTFGWALPEDDERYAPRIVKWT